MKFLDKLGLALFSILVLIISLVICLVAFGTIDFTVITAVLTNILASENGMYITIGVSVILMVLAIKCLFFPGYEKENQMKMMEFYYKMIAENYL